MFGAHLSIAGGLHNALLTAERLGCETLQVFTKSQKIWACKPLEDGSICQWKDHCKRLRFTQTISHDSYLINLAAASDELWRKSTELFIEELNRCHQLGISYLVTHPGAHMGAGEDAGITRIVAALNVIHASIRAPGVVTCLEVTAGQGTSLGYKLEHLAEIIARVKHPRRLGVCLDTAHLFAAGYDFRGGRYGKFRKELDATIGADLVKVIHVNDSKKGLGSRVDRHDHIGRGLIGLEGFRPFVRDKTWKKVPKIIETPKEGKSEDGREWDEVNLETLRKLT